MAPARTGDGDPARTLALLWRGRLPGGDRAMPRRGRPPRFTVDDVVEGALAIADADGLEALSMRAVADRLAVSPMALYAHVPSKAELLDLLLDAIYLELPLEPWRPEQLWRERLQQVAADNRALFARHPWAASVSTARPPLGPGLMAKYEHELAAFDGAGLTDIDRDAALTHLLAFVTSSCLAAEGFAAQLAAAGDPAEWWAEAGPLLEHVAEPAAYPLANRVGSAVGERFGAAYDPGYAWEFGLARTLDGFAALVDHSR